MNPVESRPTFFLEDPKDIYTFPLPPFSDLKPDQIRALVPATIKAWSKFRPSSPDLIDANRVAANLSLRYEDFMGLMAVGFQTRRAAEISYETFKNFIFDELAYHQVEGLLIDTKRADSKIIERIFGEVKRSLPVIESQESKPRIGVRRSPRHQNIDVDVDKLKEALNKLKSEGGLSVILANILELREIKKLSQIEVAQLLGITLQLVKMWEGKAWQRVKKEESLTIERNN